MECQTSLKIQRNEQTAVEINIHTKKTKEPDVFHSQEREGVGFWIGFKI